MMQESSPQLTASRPMGSARGMETAAARSCANRPPTSPHSSYWHRWRCVCSGVCVCVCVGTWSSFTFPRSQWATGQAHTWLVYITASVSSQRYYSTFNCQSVRVQRRYSEGAGVVFQKLADFSRSFIVSSWTAVWCGVLNIIQTIFSVDVWSNFVIIMLHDTIMTSVDMEHLQPLSRTHQYRKVSACFCIYSSNLQCVSTSLRIM